jgi:hypothetical protein
VKDREPISAETVASIIETMDGELDMLRNRVRYYDEKNKSLNNKLASALQELKKVKALRKIKQRVVEPKAVSNRVVEPKAVPPRVNWRTMPPESEGLPPDIGPLWVNFNGDLLCKVFYRNDGEWGFANSKNGDIFLDFDDAMGYVPAPELDAILDLPKEGDA